MNAAQIFFVKLPLKAVEAQIADQFKPPIYWFCSEFEIAIGKVFSQMFFSVIQILVLVISTTKNHENVQLGAHTCIVISISELHRKYTKQIYMVNTKIYQYPKY